MNKLILILLGITLGAASAASTFESQQAALVNACQRFEEEHLSKPVTHDEFETEVFRKHDLYLQKNLRCATPEIMAHLNILFNRFTSTHSSVRFHGIRFYDLAIFIIDNHHIEFKQKQSAIEYVKKLSERYISEAKRFLVERQFYSCEMNHSISELKSIVMSQQKQIEQQSNQIQELTARLEHLFPSLTEKESEDKTLPVA